VVVTREDCLARDAQDPIAWLRAEFAIPDPGVIYLDGNSLGRPSNKTLARLEHVLHEQWAAGLVESWDDWITLPLRAGDALGGAFLGAAPGQVVVCDGVTTNLFKAIRAALELRPGRRVIVADPDDFPTDRYLIAEIARDRGLTIRWLSSDIDEGLTPAALAEALDDEVALACLSLVAYRSGAFLDLAAVTEQVHDVGALVVWDLCHAVGAVPIALDAAGADLAVGCTYKYVNAGPGATGFLYAASGLHADLRNPMPGWMGQTRQFAMGPTYDPDPGVRRFMTGSTPMLGVAGVDSAVETLAPAGIEALRTKGVALTELLIALHDAWLAPLGFRLASPRDAARRGSHVSLEHPQALAMSQALRRHGVVPDYRVPDRLRLGPAPAYTRFVDVYDAMLVLRDLVLAGEHLAVPEDGTVT
jgi:kynureninase